MLDTLAANANVVVAGATGGIGGDFVRQLAANPRVGRVFALHRRPLAAHDDRVTPIECDLLDAAALRAATEQIADAGPIDLVVGASGWLHDATRGPEKSLAELDPEGMLAAVRANCIAPMLLARQLLPQMRRGSKTVFAALSARVGSISDNRLGGWYSYRASKAALNMMLRTASVEHRRRFPESIVVALHPGTVDTPLSAPFQQRVPEGKLFTPAFAVERLLTVVNDLRPTDTGGFFAWDGQAIDY